MFRARGGEAKFSLAKVASVEAMTAREQSMQGTPFSVQASAFRVVGGDGFPREP